ncbi:dynein axonemal assembly factor 4-like [Planococcus citri]|uniref:dynein axonemal assembly factor 4-like n=1 Tax=Planococcus citri TaxID=170843 RepID=UPI0031FA3566
MYYFEMPIFIRDYTWKQTDSAIVINVPIKNVRSSKLYFVVTNEFVKINYESFIFELFLCKNVVETKTKCIVRSNEVVLELQKAEPGIWESLGRPLQQQEIVEKVEQVLANKREHDTAQTKMRKDKKEEVTRYLKDEMMNIHIKEKESIQQFKKDTMTATVKEIVSWENNLKGKQTATCNTKVVIPPSIPFPRKCNTINFSFTPRAFPTPKRESKSEEEKEWLEKEAEARRCSGFVAEELSEEEKDPKWLLSKGESFMKHENYLGAANVFAFGIQSKPKMPIFYIRLAAVNLKLKRYYKAAECSTKALDLLQPVVQKNKTMRAEAFNIRGESFRNMEETALSESDFNNAKLLLK